MIQKIFVIILVLKLVIGQNFYFQQCLTQICKLQPQQSEIQLCLRENKQCQGFIGQNLSDCQNMQCSVKCSAYLSYEDQECVLNCTDKIEPQISDDCSKFLAETSQEIVENQQQRQETVQQFWVIITVGTIIFSILAFIVYFVVQLIKKLNKQKQQQNLQEVVVVSQSQVNYNYCCCQCSRQRIRKQSKQRQL
ncbi:hypothetical protein ABPG72_002457 [Tetrahymena utriculariae]